MSKGPPTGRISSKRRPFENVVADIRHAVFSVIRRRPQGAGFQCTALGSGFFVSRTVFVTCAHVLMHPANPHIDGDNYDLVNNFGATATVQYLPRAVLGTNVHIFADCDLALLLIDESQTRPYLALDYEDPLVGSEIGVAGYPLPKLTATNNRLDPDGLIYRVARNVVTATYTTTINSDTGITLPDMPVIEVNFLFVPGNSGGPIFSAETGRALGFVHGYHSQQVRNASALYSLAFALNRVRPHLEQYGVAL